MHADRAADDRRPRVLLACSGLDHAHRGFESFARECFEALRADPGVELELVKGSGPSGPGERSVPTLRRDRLLARGLGRTLRARPFRIEAFAFAFALGPLIARRRPHVVYLSEWDTARNLAALRSLTGQRFKLLLSNGGFAAEGFEHLDHVQEVTPAGLEHVLARGADPRRHSLLPYGLQIERELPGVGSSERLALRGRLGLPIDRPIVLSVAALNRHHKRIDYLIEELAAVPEPRPFLLLVGEPDPETPGLRSLAEALLGVDGYDVRTVRAAEVSDLYTASDLFVLASLAEAQGRVLIEAISHGLPCIAHDSSVMRFALGPHGLYGDLTLTGRLTSLLEAHVPGEPAAADPRRSERHRFAYERFSWEKLRPRYVELLRIVASPRSDQLGPD